MNRRSFLESLSQFAGIVGVATVAPPGMPTGTEGAIVVPRTPDVEQAVKQLGCADCIAIPRHTVRNVVVEREAMEDTRADSTWMRSIPSDRLTVTLTLELRHSDILQVLKQAQLQ